MEKIETNTLPTKHGFACVKVLFYCLLIAALGEAAHDFELFEMIEGRGALLRIISFVPGALWGAIAALSYIGLLNTVRANLRSEDKLINTLLWIAMGWTILAYILGIIIDNIGSDIYYSDPKIEALQLMLSVLVFIATAGLFAFLGVKLCTRYSGKINTLGKIFIYVPTIVTLIVFIIMALLPDSYGELEYDYDSYSYSSYGYYNTTAHYSGGTIFLTIVMILIVAMEYIIPGAFIMGIFSEGDDIDDSIIDYNAEDNITNTPSSKTPPLPTQVTIYTYAQLSAVTSGTIVTIEGIGKCEYSGKCEGYECFYPQDEASAADCKYTRYDNRGNLYLAIPPMHIRVITDFSS